MSYMLLILEPPGQREARGVAGGEVAYAQMLAFAARLQERGVLEAAQSLSSTRDGARLEKRGGQVSVVDGPFAEAKEMIGGFFLLTVDDREEALAIAAECPAAEWATVEVRKLGPCFT